MDANLDIGCDKLFRDSIELLVEIPGKYVWDNIEQELDRNDVENYKRKYITYQGLAVALLFIVSRLP